MQSFSGDNSAGTPCGTGQINGNPAIYLLRVLRVHRESSGERLCNTRQTTVGDGAGQGDGGRWMRVENGALRHGE